jgi:serine/threonine protein kinase
LVLVYFIVNFSDFELREPITDTPPWIYKAAHLSSGELVVMKEIPFQMSANIDSALESVQLLGTLRHPALLSFRGIIPEAPSSLPVILSPFMPHGSLETLLQLESEGRSPPEWNSTARLKCLIGLASAIMFLDSVKVIHGCLRPSNILFDANFEVRISNFAQANLICLRQMSPAFTAPEVLTKRDFTPSCDSYSFGMVLYALVTGTTPFKDAAAHVILAKVKSGERPPIRELQTPAFASLMRNCWMGNPQSRPIARQILIELLSPDILGVVRDLDYDSIRDYLNRMVPQELIRAVGPSMSRRPEPALVRPSHCGRTIRFRPDASGQLVAAVPVEASPVPTPVLVSPPVSTDLPWLPFSADEIPDYILVTSVYEASLLLGPNDDVGRFELNIGDYDMGKLIGAGAWGDVFIAKEKKTGKQVVVKQMKNRKSELNQEKNFNREVLILATVNHPAVLHLIGYTKWSFLNGAAPRMVLPFMSGGSLDEMIALERTEKAPEKWTVTKKLISLLGIASGMMFLHESSIIHRDLKLENVLLDEKLEPRVCDFGFSKVVDMTRARQQSMICGTGRFMAPELHEERPFDFKVDVYAYAMVMFEVLTGIIPFENVTNEAKMGEQVMDGIRPAFPETLPAPFQELISNYWHGNPDWRPEFNEVVLELGKEEVLETVEGLDLKEYLDYQKRVVPQDLMPSISGQFAAKFSQ